MANEEAKATQMIDAALDAWLGRERRLRLEAVTPGAGLTDLVERLRALPQKEWPAACADHARDRAADICLYHKPGDLWFRGGRHFWNMYGGEFYDALKIVTESPRVQRLRIYGPAMDAAETAFKETAERLRDRLTGYTAAERKAMDEAGVDHGLPRSETLDEAVKRLETAKDA